MTRHFTQTEDRFLLLADQLPLSNETMAAVIGRSPIVVYGRLRLLREREASRALRPKGFPRRAPCMGCETDMKQQHAGHRHCERCRRGMTEVSPFAPDIYCVEVAE